MSKEQIISQVRTEVGTGQTSKALQTLLSFLESDKKYRRLADIAHLARAQFVETQAEVRKGLISNSEADLVFNRVRQTVFDLLNDLDQNNLRPDRYEIEPDTTSKRQLWVLWSILGVLIIGVVTALYFFVFQTTNNTATADSLQECPVFEPASDFHILLFPFRTYRASNFGTAASILQRLRSLAEDYDLSTTPALFSNVEEARQVVLPPGREQAERIARECNSHLVVWGTDEPLGNTGQTLVSAEYSYTGPPERFKFTQFVLQENDVVDTVQMISNIALQGSLTTQPLEQIVLTFFGISAFSQKKYQAVITELEAGKDTTFIGNLMLADSYFAENEEEKAIEKYDTVLARHPNYPLARNNRGVLLYKQGKYLEAIEDFNAKLDMSPQDTNTLVARANAYMKTKQLEKANKDLLKARDLMPRNQTILDRIREVEKAKQSKRREVENATANIRTNINVSEALVQRSEALQSLGNIDQAIEDARQAIRQAPSNPKPYGILIESYYENKEKDKLEEVLKLAEQNNVSRASIENVNSKVREILSGSQRLNFELSKPILQRQQ